MMQLPVLSSALTFLPALVQWSEYMDSHSGAAVLDPSNSGTERCLKEHMALVGSWEFY